MCLCARAREYARAGRGTRAGERCSRTTAATDLLRRFVCVCGRGAVQLHDGGDGPAAAQLRPRVQPDGGGLGQKVRAQSTNLGPNRLQAVL